MQKKKNKKKSNLSISEEAKKNNGENKVKFRDMAGLKRIVNNFCSFRFFLLPFFT